MRFQYSSASLFVAALAGIASAQVVNLGNLAATSTLQSVPVVVPPNGPYSSVNVRLNWVAGSGGATSSNARWNLRNGLAFIGTEGSRGPGSGAAANPSPATLSWSTNFSPITTGTVLTFNYFQLLNLSSASWNDVTLTFSNFTAPASTFLGSITTGSPLTISAGSPAPAFDTVLALFDSTGTLIGNDDDDGPGSFSQLVSTLGVGTYYAGVVDFLFSNSSSGGAAFGYVMLGGNDAGTTTLSVTNGTTRLTSPGEALAVGGVNWYSFTVVPTPGAAALLGLGGLAMARCRR